MKIKDLIKELKFHKQHVGAKRVRFHSREQLNMEVLSIYVSRDGKYIEIDVGKERDE